MLVDAYILFRDSDRKALLQENLVATGGLYAKLDLKRYGAIRPQTKESLRKGESIRLETQKRSLRELSFAAASIKDDPKAYENQIRARLDPLGPEDDLKGITDEIVAKHNRSIQYVQKERDQDKALKKTIQRQRGGWYVFYLIIQVVGIALTILAEANQEGRNSQQWHAESTSETAPSAASEASDV
jgi:hypothetical protein